mgnify:CR=1 FL=1
MHILCANSHPSTLPVRLASAAIIAAVLVFSGRQSEAGESSRQAVLSAPHPAVVRIIAPGRNSVSYGSGALVAVSQYHGLVVTNWHVIREAAGTIHVLFPNGFRSPATVLRADRDWDLAALAIWRPPVEPIPLAREAPRPGQWLWIAGYGKGSYRAAAGRCTQYFAPGVNMPHEIVELSVGAREGDSGGPILNERGELAGVLFGTSWGTTMGSYCGRVERFLAATASQFQRLAPPPAEFAQQYHNPPPSNAFGPQTQPQRQPAQSAGGWVARQSTPQTTGAAGKSNEPGWLWQRQAAGGTVTSGPGSEFASVGQFGANGVRNATAGHQQGTASHQYDAQIPGPSAPVAAAEYGGKYSLVPRQGEYRLLPREADAGPIQPPGAADAASAMAAHQMDVPAPGAPVAEGYPSDNGRHQTDSVDQPRLESLKNILALAGALLLAFHALRLLGRAIG